MNHSLTHKFLCLSATILISICAHARVTLPGYLSDNMVVQQQSTLKVKGHSTRTGQVKVTASWNNKPVTAPIASNGTFSVALPTPKAGGPYTIIVNDGDALTLDNVLVGEVWFCSGQSNMEMPVKGWGKVLNYEQELAAASHPEIRLLQSKRVTALTPASEPQLNGEGWAVCSPTTVENFSSVAYFFARQLSQALGVHQRR